MFDPQPLHARALELLAAAPDEATVRIDLKADEFPPGFHVGVWMMRFAADLGSAFANALADRPAVRRVEIVCPEMFRVPMGFDIPPKN